MSSAIEPNLFQKFLIPEESYYTRLVMVEAAHCAESDNRLKAHGLSALLASLAVALSVFNTASYFLRIPFKLALDIIELKPHYLIPHLLLDIMNTGLSFIFVCLGSTTLIAMAILMPKMVFVKFAPYVPKTQEEILEEKLRRAEDEKKDLKTQSALKDMVIDHLKTAKT